MHRALVGSVVAITALVIACRNVSAPPAEPTLRIQTSDTSYVLDQSPYRYIPATVTNVGSQPVTLAICDSIVGGLSHRSIVAGLSEQWYEGHWVAGYPSLGCAPLIPVRLGPGETRDLDARAHILGRFRLRVPIFGDSTHFNPSRETSPVFSIL